MTLAQTDDQPWRLHAACLFVDDPEIFFPYGKGHQLRRNSLQARLVCQQCPVQVECLDEALDIDTSRDWGVWAGTLPEERVKMRRNRRDARSRQARREAR